MRSFPLSWRRLVALCFLLGVAPVASYAQTWHWAQGSGGTSSYATHVVADSLGNQYVSGVFSGSVNLGPFTLTSAGAYDSYIAKLDSTGGWLWVRQLSGAGKQEITRLRLDDRHAALLLVANTTAPASLSGVAVADSSSFVARLSAATGTPQWAQMAERIGDVAADPAGNVVICGTYADTLQLGSFTVNDSASLWNDLYVASLTPAGTWQWLLKAGNEWEESATSLVIDRAGAMYIGGSYKSPLGFGASAQFGPHKLAEVYSSDRNYFIAKLSPSHSWEWAEGFNTWDRSDLWALSLDNKGRVYAAASGDANVTVNDSTIFDFSTRTRGDVFYVVSLTSQGKVRWVASPTLFPNIDESWPLELVAGENGRMFVTGVAYGDSILIGNYALPGAAAVDDSQFLAALDSAGRWQWAESRPGPYAVATSSSGHRLTYAGGFDDAQASFPPFTLTNPTPTTSQTFVAQRGLPGFIDAFSPTNGPAGTIVTLSGVGFAGTTAVNIGGIPATFTVLSNGQIQVTVPPGVPATGGVIQIAGPNGASLSSTLFGARVAGVAAASAIPAFDLYPNPARERVRLTGLAAGAPAARVLDAVGRVVRTQAAPGAELDVRGLPAGVYTVRVGAAARRLVVE